MLKTNTSLGISYVLSRAEFYVRGVETVAGVNLQSILFVKDGTAQVLRSTRNFQARSKGDYSLVGPADICVTMLGNGGSKRGKTKGVKSQLWRTDKGSITVIRFNALSH